MSKIQRKVVQTVILFREGQRVKPEIGKVFEFTQAEYEQIQKVNPDALVKPIVELSAEDIAKIQAARDAAATNDTAPKKPATAKNDKTKKPEEGQKPAENQNADDDV